MYLHKITISKHTRCHQVYDSSILNSTCLWLVKDLLFPYKVVNHLIYLMIKNNHGPVFMLNEYEYEIEDKNPEHSKSEN